MASSVVEAASPPPPRQTTTSPNRRNSQHSPLAPARKQSASEASEREENDDLDPAAFLKSVRELSEKREREDNERYRKLEEEIEKGRQERLARRLAKERARSISPQKQQPETPTSALQTGDNANTPSSTLAAFGSPPPTTPPNRSIADSMAQPGEIPEFKGFGSIKRGSAPSTPGSVRRTANTSDNASNASPSAAMPQRSNTMKWQQRPASRGGPTSRPMSMAAPAHTRDASVDEPQLSRDQIAASLGARDPSYFKQTADRGVGNAAYRKSKDEMSGEDDVFTGRRGLPGMSSEDSAEPARRPSPAPESVASEASSKFDSARENGAGSVRSSATPSIADSKQSNDLPLRAFSTTSRSSTTTDSNEPSTLSRTPTMSASQARLAGAGERPPSPTKGMGGFVQSALMKRSDSQNKRWSAQPTASLSRPESVSSMRSGLGGMQSSYSMPKLDPITTGSHEGSHESPSRPTSSSSNLPNLATRPHDGGNTRPGMPSRHHSRSKSMASTYSTNADHDGGLTSPMGSPSKRWSPNKSSWIESALARPDSPKLSPARTAQPSWMENIARAKAQRTSAEAVPTMGSPNPNQRSRPGSPTKETPFGPAMLKRSDSQMRPNTGNTRSVTPPTKTKPVSLSSRPTSVLTQESLQISERLATPTTKDETANFTLETMPRQSSDSVEADPATKTLEPERLATKEPEKQMVHTPVEKPASPDLQDETEPVKSPPSTKPKPEAMRESLDLEKKPTSPETTDSTLAETSKPAVTAKPDPEPMSPPKPTTNFRDSLRSRPVSEIKTQEQPEFLSKFGSLRKAQTEKYVAPDVLKDNITRGKRGLTITGGPQKRERKDELRDSLLAKKEQWKQEKEAGITHERKISQPPATASKPEALAKRELLSRKESVRAGDRSPEKTRNITPEALRFQKSIREKPKAQPPPVAEKPRAVSGQLNEEAHSVRTASPPAQEEPAASIKEKSPSPPHTEEKRVVSPPASAPTSKLAARFNPGLAGLLARGPPTGSGSPSASRSESPADADTSTRTAQAPAGEPAAQGPPLADVRKGRAKGPKKRKAAGPSSGESKTAQPDVLKEIEEPVVAANDDVDTPATTAAEEAPSPQLSSNPSPSAPFSARFGGKGPAPGSAASIMAASLNNAGQRHSPAGPRGPPLSSASKPVQSSKPAISPKPIVSPKPNITSPGADEGSPAPPVKSLSFPKRAPSDKSTNSSKNEIPEFKGFGSLRRQQPTSSAEEDKENTDSSSPPVKDAASSWGAKKTYKSTESPSQIKLPTRRDEEAAMRSASLLASSPARSPSRPGSSNGLAFASPIGSPSPAIPPKPAKSSRIVSGQLREASPNKDSQGLGKLPETEAERLLVDSFGSWPTSTGPLSIDTQSIITSCGQPRKRAKTLRKSIQRVETDGSVRQLGAQEEYTLFDESVYVCTHTHTPDNGSKSTHVIAWAGSSSTASNLELATSVAKAEVKREGSYAQLRINQQGHEQAELFEALGGILVTRRGTREAAPKQFMLCGRKHLGHIAFDEVDFALSSLCSAFAYLISFPVTLQETKLYLWKGTACSNEEISAAKLAAMDLSETGEIIEVDQGAEFASFLNIFGPGTSKARIPPSGPIWEHKAAAPDKFSARLFSIQQSDARAGIFSAMFRRPSWGLRSPAPEPGVKAEVNEITPFTPSDLDAEGLYLLDAYGELYLMLGPLFFSLQPENVRNALFSQALLFASDYAILSASIEDRPAIPKAQVLFAGCPPGVDGLFRGWDAENGLWGLGGLMAGSSVKGKVGEEVKSAGVEELVRAVCQ